MADNKKLQEEELKKLENEAYFELCQIIAEAMQLQDIEFLNTRIASWKNKYKKLLDIPTTNSKSNLKKRIELLLNDYYYSKITQYILDKLKFKEQEMIKNQSKALRELYTIIRDTNDYDLLKKKVEKWESKYPISGFLNMYQKRIELSTRDKNIRENAFKQEEAFKDLVDITKINGTLDELQYELRLWAEKYSINDKYSVDDFLNHQTEVKRFTSVEFLQSISKEKLEPYNSDKNNQANAFAALTQISKSANNVDEMFTWVYKNKDMKFNDKYKELILTNPSIHLNYSPAYLKTLDKPKINMSKSSISYDEYLNITDIKRYAIISYFNLLLPAEKAVSNDYFNKHIETIYAKSERARTNDVKEENFSVNLDLDSSSKKTIKEISVSYVPEIDSKSIEVVTSKTYKNSESIQPQIKITNIETDLDSEETSDKETVVTSLNIENDKKSEIVLDLSNVEPELTFNLNQPEDYKSEPNDTKKEEPLVVVENPINNETSATLYDKTESKEELDYTTIVALSPLFFEIVNNYNIQANLIDRIDSTVSEHIEYEKSKENSFYDQVKTKIDEE